MVAQLWEYTSNYWIIHFQMENFVAHVLYLNKKKDL